MAILSGLEILKNIESGDIEVDPFEPGHLNPVSLDLRLGKKIAVYEAAVQAELRPKGNLEDGRHFIPRPGGGISMARENAVLHFDIGDGGWVLKPGILYLMHTHERVCAKKHVPILDGKSSIGRLGIQVHFTAGFGDPGFDGQYTLEVSAMHPVHVFAGSRFCQIRFHEITGEVRSYRDHQSNYSTVEHSRGPVPSRSWKMFER
jgi:dCTP deaminase